MSRLISHASCPFCTLSFCLTPIQPRVEGLGVELAQLDGQLSGAKEAAEADSEDAEAAGLVESLTMQQNALKGEWEAANKALLKAQRCVSRLLLLLCFGCLLLIPLPVCLPYLISFHTCTPSTRPTFLDVLAAGSPLAQSGSLRWTTKCGD